MPEEDFEALSEQVQSDLGVRLGALGQGYILTKYMAVAEVIAQDGERSIISVVSPDMRAWDTLGMLTYSLQLEQAGLIDDSGEA